MKRPELLAPAGDLNKLKTAIRYGADAVYLGGEQFGLRAMAGNFSLAELRKGINICHEQGKSLFLTLNAYLFPDEFATAEDYLEELKPLGIDAYIISDPGLLNLVKRVDPDREVHLSTQVNTTNAHAANFWLSQGIERINLARELTLAEMAQIRQGTTMGLEVFVHGAMCVAYSGRCLLSTAMTGRSANSGACAQPCRWSYALMDENRPGEYYQIEEDNRGSYVFNSKDLCLVERVPDLIAAGVDSLKIEGRMKTLYYVAAVTRIYREIIDRYCADPTGFHFDPSWLSELEKVSHRPHAQGFLDGRNDPRIFPADSQYRRTHDFVGVVEAVGDDGRCEVGIRTKTLLGDELELIGPEMRRESICLAGMSKAKGESVDVAQPNDLVLIDLPSWVEPGDILRREKLVG